MKLVNGIVDVLYSSQRAKTGLLTANEEAGHIAFHNDLVEHDTDDGMDENKKTKNKRNQKGIESTST